MVGEECGGASLSLVLCERPLLKLAGCGAGGGDRRENETTLGGGGGGVFVTVSSVN